MAAPSEVDDLGLSIVGLGTQYPPNGIKPGDLDVISKRFHPDSPAMRKVLSINRFTGIDQRASIGTTDHPIVNQPDPPTIADLHRVFMSDGVPLAVSAARKALTEARVDAGEVTHMVSTTCTDSANPGFDHFVAKELGLNQTVEKTLLHGVGCSGGLAALRTAANLCLGHTMRRLPARILVVALEISTTLVRSELESINALQETRIGIALFSDCAGALVLTNNLAPSPVPPIYSLLTWQHHTLPSSDTDLGFDVDPLGWKVILSPAVPTLAASTLRPTFASLLSPLLPSLPPSYRSPPDFDWAMHPGGATILTGAEKELNITPQHMRASYDTYIKHGNSSSATILSVLDHLRGKEMDALAPPDTEGGGDGQGGGGRVKDYVVGCAFGPGITVEMCLLKRNLGGVGSARPGMETPPETESEASAGSEDGDEGSESRGAEGEGIDEEARIDRGEKEINTGNSVKKTLDSDRREGEEAFISEALEGVELD